MRGEKIADIPLLEKVASKEESCGPAVPPCQWRRSRRGLISAASFSRPPPSLFTPSPVRSCDARVHAADMQTDSAAPALRLSGGRFPARLVLNEGA